VGLGWASFVGAQSDQPDVEIAPLEEKVARFFEEMSAGPPLGAYQQLLAGSWLAKEKDGLKTLAEKTAELKDKYGECRRPEKIVAKRVGVDVVLLKYLYKCERSPVVWHVTFYRPPSRGAAGGVETGGNWEVIAVRFDTDLESLAR
jgi:hypothetical protein